MPRIGARNFEGVRTYNDHPRGQAYNNQYREWCQNNLVLIDHQCPEVQENVRIRIPREHTSEMRSQPRPFFRVDVCVDTHSEPAWLVERCIYCADLEKPSSPNNSETEREIVGFFDETKSLHNESTVPTSKSVFAWWTDLFLPLDRTHNYNAIAWEAQAMETHHRPPINRSNEIQKVDGEMYVGILRCIRRQLLKLKAAGFGPSDLRGTDNSIQQVPFMRIIDKCYW